VSGYGCSTIKYDCNQNTGSIALLLKFYEDNGIKTGVAAECGGARQQYTYACVKHQCLGGPDPGAPPKVDDMFPTSYKIHKVLDSPICQGRDPWYNGVETGACLSNHAPFPESDFMWHCPWESNCLVSGYGCSTIKYDCNQNTGSIALLLKFYEDNGIKTGVAAECGGARQQYTYACVKHQCLGGPDPGAPPKVDDIFPTTYKVHKVSDSIVV